jgi:hypothetical protein
MAAEEPKADDDLGEDGDAEEGDKDKYNPDLLQACMKNDTTAALALIEKGADPCCEDSRQWSPLIWAASHGNETLTRALIKHNAADVYKYEGMEGKVKKKKHSPLHWAAFKGHLKELWLLLGQNLSHHERDQIGNTALHQAGAGGSLECTKCLMAQGADVFAKNDRGHTPYALCTVPEVQRLLQSAMNTVACKATGKQFSSTVLRYLCSLSLDVFCDIAVTQTCVYENPDAVEKEKPVTWCTEVKNTIQEAESHLSNAMHLNQLETITSALAAAEDKPVDCKLVHQCRLVKAKLESEIELANSMQCQVITHLDMFSEVHENLSRAIEDAEAKNADPPRIQAAKMLRRKLMSEASLLRAVEGPQKTTPGHISMLEELTSAAKAENANDELLTRASKLIAKLKSEREVQQRIAECLSLVALSSFKDAAGKEDLPAWAPDTVQFEDFHEEYKKVVNQADLDMISGDLMSSSLEQLAKLEHLLVEKKQMEEEQKLKANKKKKKM